MCQPYFSNNLECCLPTSTINVIVIRSHAIAWFGYTADHEITIDVEQIGVVDTALITAHYFIVSYKIIWIMSCEDNLWNSSIVIVHFLLSIGIKPKICKYRIWYQRIENWYQPITCFILLTDSFIVVSHFLWNKLNFTIGKNNEWLLVIIILAFRELNEAKLPFSWLEYNRIFWWSVKLILYVLILAIKFESCIEVIFVFFYVKFRNEASNNVGWLILTSKENFFQVPVCNIISF